MKGWKWDPVGRVEYAVGTGANPDKLELKILRQMLRMGDAATATDTGSPRFAGVPCTKMGLVGDYNNFRPQSSLQTWSFTALDIRMRFPFQILQFIAIATYVLTASTLVAADEITTLTRISLSPDKRHAVVIRPKQGEEELAWQIVLLRSAGQHELFHKEFIPYSEQEPVALVDWNTDSSIAAVAFKGHRHGLDCYFFAITDENVQLLIPGAGENLADETRETGHQGWYNPVGWIGSDAFIFHYKHVSYIKHATAPEEMDWKEEYGHHVWQFRQHGNSQVMAVNLTTSDDIEERYAAADLELNHFYKRVLEETAKEARPAVRNAQRTWLAFRDADVAARTKADNMATTPTLYTLTRERADYLRRIVEPDT